MKNYLTLTSLLLITALPFVSYATHVAGSDISYACTATPGIFKVTLVIYRDCGSSNNTVCQPGNNCAAPCSQAVSITSGDGGCSSFSQSIMCSLVNVRDVNPEPNCPTANNTCRNNGCKPNPGTFSLAFERYQFEGFVNLGPTSGIPANCCNVRLAWQLCCRSSDIATGAANAPFYIDAVINRCLSISPCNSSPSLTNDPITFLCGGMPAQINYGAVDPDGDSLSFAFAPALTNVGASVSYTPPFSFDRPMPWTGNVAGAFPAGISCNPLTGDIQFQPSNASGINFKGVVAIEIRQWRRISGVLSLMGITRRDADMVVLANCPSNNGPRFTTNPPTAINPLAARTNWQVCAGQQLCFNVTAKDTDVISPSISDTTRLSWDSSLIALGATFQPVYSHSQTQRRTLGPREDDWRFCWTPTISQARKEPYLFTITAKDSRCPIPGRITRGFTINVGAPATATPLTINKVSQGCNKWVFNYAATLPVGAIARWEIARNPGDFSFTTALDTFINRVSTPSLFFRQAGSYAVRLIVSQPSAPICDFIYYDTLVVPTNSLSINTPVKDTVVCAGNSITLSATVIGGISPFTYRWFNSIADTNSTPLNTNFTTGNFTVTPTLSRLYTVQVRDSLGCLNYDSTRVRLSGGLTNLTANNISCNGQSDGSITAVNNSGFNYSYQLNSGPFVASNVFQNLAGGIYSLTVRDSINNCSITYPNLAVSMPPVLKDTLVIVNPETCTGSRNASIIANATGGTSPYQYSLDSITFTASGTFTSLAAATYKVHIRDSSNCYSSFLRTINTGLLVAGVTGKTNTEVNKVDTYSFVPTRIGLSFVWTVSKEGTFIGPTNTTTAIVRWDTAGTGTLKAYIFQTPSCNDSSLLSVTITPSVGLTEMEKTLGIKVYPNPTSASLNISLTHLPEYPVLKLYDMQGKLLLEQTLTLDQTLDLSALPKGVYILQIAQWHKQVIKD